MKSKQEFDYIKIKLASPARILEWGQRQLPNGQLVGKVARPATINYRTLKPEMRGLFCERTFGPIKNWECHCGKYKRVKHYGLICDRCGVEITESRVRRHRMGHIKLIFPVIHIWYLRSVPSYLCLLLDIKRSILEGIIYFNNNKIEIENLKKEETDLKKTKFINFAIKNGAYAIQQKLEEFDLVNEAKLARKLIDNFDVNTDNEKIKDKLIKRLRIIENFISTGANPSWMILSILPVMPAGLRPMVQLDGGRFAASDLNELYRQVITRNNRLIRLLKMFPPEIILRNEKRLIQEAVDSLIDNGKRVKKVLGANNRPLRSLSDIIKGKQGRFRQNLLGKRVDYSGRSVIVVGPDLKLNECGLPYEMAIELFSPFIMHELIKRDLACSMKIAKKIINKKDPLTKELLKDILSHHPVLLNRAPTLHRLGIQAFEPILVEGRAIKLHPLVCSAFNADFDGDQMAVHVPLSLEAQAEALILMLTPYNFLSPATGEPILMPSQDMVLGCYYLTSNNIKNLSGSNHYFADINDVYLAYEHNKINLHSLIWVRYNLELKISKNYNRILKLKNNSFIEFYDDIQIHKDFKGNIITKYLQTTPGRIIFNQIIQQSLNLF
jgi:DNA-directed RNA polymerase subunit beta'